MTRAVNINATLEDVSAACRRRGLTISAIETLVSGGTRVVLMNGVAADSVRRVFGKRVLTGAVQRTPLRSWAR